MSKEDIKVLVVDDDEMNRDMLSRRLKRAGYQVQTAIDGYKALAAVRAEEFDLVILDIAMPGISGIEVLRILRESYSTNELPIIMATAHSASEDVVEALDLGANDYVTKPIDFPVLLARIHSHLRTKRSAAKEAVPTSSAVQPTKIEPGSVIAESYQLISKLGTGSTGMVFRALHLRLETEVAIKILRSSLDTSEQAVMRFRQEGISTCRVKHPNAVSVLDFGVTPDGIAYLVMELLEGRSLADLLGRQARITLRQCAKIVQPICEVLAEAHSVGVIHRDIKPENIFLQATRQGVVVKVLDFGISKLVGDMIETSKLTADGTLVGTPAYMAPERLRNESYDGRSDVYSLGIMIYEMLLGQVPFRSAQGDLLALIQMQLNESPTPPSQLVSGFPPAIENLILQCLDKDPVRRPAAGQLGPMFVDAVSRY